MSKKIINPDGQVEWLFSQDEKELIDIAIHNLAVSTGNTSLVIGRSGEHE